MTQVRTRKIVEKGGFATRDAAYKAGVEAYNDFLHGNIGITSESISLKDFMTNWLANVVAANVKLSSLQTYESRFYNQIAPHLGEFKVQDLTPEMLDNWVRNLQQKGLSYNTISSLHAFIHNTLNYAVYPAQFKALPEKCPFGTPLYIPFLLTCGSSKCSA